MHTLWEIRSVPGTHIKRRWYPSTLLACLAGVTCDVERNSTKWNSLEYDAKQAKFNENPYKETNNFPRQTKKVCYKLKEGSVSFKTVQDISCLCLHQVIHTGSHF
jgi:hypothetical protein